MYVCIYINTVKVIQRHETRQSEIAYAINAIRKKKQSVRLPVDYKTNNYHVIYICICTCICVYIHIVYKYIHIRELTYIHTYIYIFTSFDFFHLHTHAHTFPFPHLYQKNFIN